MGHEALKRLEKKNWRKMKRGSIWGYAHFYFHGGQSLEGPEEMVLDFREIVWMFKEN